VGAVDAAGEVERAAGQDGVAVEEERVVVGLAAAGRDVAAELGRAGRVRSSGWSAPWSADRAGKVRCRGVDDEGVRAVDGAAEG
jgi:hypothetical protein